MKVINPIGRDTTAYTDANYIDPKACMCANSFSYSSALDYEDNCNHCGCNCLPWNKAANYNAAYNAGRSS